MSTSHQGVGENEKEWDEQMRTSHQGVGENEINWDERRAQTSTEADERFWPKMPVLNISQKLPIEHLKKCVTKFKFFCC